MSSMKYFKFLMIVSLIIQFRSNMNNLNQYTCTMSYETLASMRISSPNGCQVVMIALHRAYYMLADIHLVNCFQLKKINNPFAYKFT